MAPPGHRTTHVESMNSVLAPQETEREREREGGGGRERGRNEGKPPSKAASQEVQERLPVRPLDGCSYELSYEVICKNS